MNDIVVVSLYSCFMFVGSCVTGFLPLLVKPTGNKGRLVTVFGAGLLFGAALALIIPEGFESTAERATCTSVGQVHIFPPISKSEANGSAMRSSATLDFAAFGFRGDRAVDGGGGEFGARPTVQASTALASGRGLAGLALVAGFTLMLMVDQLSSGGSVDHEHTYLGDGSGDDGEAATTGHKAREPLRGGNGRGFSATVGLIVHGLADGVALGAATTTTSTDSGNLELSAIVFVAIMLHKAPASFGLSTFLLRGGLGRAAVCKRVLAFAASAPAAALVTCASLAAESRETLSGSRAAGFALLFSGGTFLYVAAVGVLPEVSSKLVRTVADDGTVTVSTIRNFSKCELAAVALGALVPVAIAFARGE